MHFEPIGGAKALVAGAAILALAACGSTPQAATPATTVAVPIYDRVEPQTGSNLPRRSGRASAVVEVDKDAVQGAARGATRSSGPNN